MEQEAVEVFTEVQWNEVEIKKLKEKIVDIHDDKLFLYKKVKVNAHMTKSLQRKVA